MYLIDTDVISAAAPPGHAAQADLARWMEAASASLFLSVVTVAEIEDGIAQATRRGAARKAADLKAWLEAVVHLYAGRILPFDIPVARIAGQFADRARSLGHAPGLPDIIIAATAHHHGLTILSRNLRRFEPLAIPALNPFAALPPS